MKRGSELLDIYLGIQRVLVNDYQGCVLRDSISFAELEAECVYNVISSTLVDGVNDEWGIEPSFLYADSRVSVCIIGGVSVCLDRRGILSLLLVRMLKEGCCKRVFTFMQYS